MAKVTVGDVLGFAGGPGASAVVDDERTDLDGGISSVFSSGLALGWA
jgi:hypothetical protein